jgi:hypothetical protein
MSYYWAIAKSGTYCHAAEAVDSNKTLCGAKVYHATYDLVYDFYNLCSVCKSIITAGNPTNQPVE